MRDYAEILLWTFLCSKTKAVSHIHLIVLFLVSSNPW